MFRSHNSNLTWKRVLDNRPTSFLILHGPRRILHKFWRWRWRIRRWRRRRRIRKQLCIWRRLIKSRARSYTWGLKPRIIHNPRLNLRIQKPKEQQTTILTKQKPRTILRTNILNQITFSIRKRTLWIRANINRGNQNKGWKNIVKMNFKFKFKSLFLSHFILHVPHFKVWGYHLLKFLKFDLCF